MTNWWKILNMTWTSSHDLNMQKFRKITPKIWSYYLHEITIITSWNRPENEFLMRDAELRCSNVRGGSAEALTRWSIAAATNERMRPMYSADRRQENTRPGARRTFTQKILPSGTRAEKTDLISYSIIHLKPILGEMILQSRLFGKLTKRGPLKQWQD